MQEYEESCKHIPHMNVEMKYDVSLKCIYLPSSPALTVWTWSVFLVTLSMIYNMCFASSSAALWWILFQYRLEKCCNIPRMHTLSSFESAAVWIFQKLARSLNRRYGLHFRIPFVKCFLSSLWISTLGFTFLLMRLSPRFYCLDVICACECLWVGSLPHIRQW